MTQHLFIFCSSLRIFLPNSYRVSALPLGSQRPLHPPHSWLHSHHPRIPSQLLIVLKDPWNTTLPQLDFPGEEGGRGPHPTQVTRNHTQTAPHHQPAAARLQEHQVQDWLHREYQVPAQRRTGDALLPHFTQNL